MPFGPALVRVRRGRHRSPAHRGPWKREVGPAGFEPAAYSV